MKFIIIIALLLTLSITNKVVSQSPSIPIKISLRSLLIGIFEDIDSHSVDKRSNFGRIFEDANRTCMFEKLLISENSQDAKIKFSDEIFYDMENLGKLSVLTTALELCRTGNSNFESVKFLKEALKNQQVDEAAFKCAEMKISSQNNELSENCEKILDNLYQFYSSFDYQAVTASLESFGFVNCVKIVQNITKNTFCELMLAGYGEVSNEHMEEKLKNINIEKKIRFENILSCLLKEI